jgi:hypothetical protein
MWDDAPYSALTATLKIRNVRAEKLPKEPCGYGRLAAARRVPCMIFAGKEFRLGTAAAQATAPLAKARAL